VDFVVHIFSEQARKFYDLERLWKTAARLELSDLEKPARKAATKASPPRKSAAQSPVRSASKKAVARKSPVSRKRP